MGGGQGVKCGGLNENGPHRLIRRALLEMIRTCDLTGGTGSLRVRLEASRPLLSSLFSDSEVTQLTPPPSCCYRKPTRDDHSDSVYRELNVFITDR